MASYICLNCGSFHTGDENRRMMNHCPECEQTINNAANLDDTVLPDDQNWDDTVLQDDQNWDNTGLLPSDEEEK